MMTWQVSWRVICERCKRKGPLCRQSDKAESTALREGWQKGDCLGMALHLCKDCVEQVGLPIGWPEVKDLKLKWEGER